MRKKAILAAKLLVTAALLWAVYRKLNFSVFLAGMASAKPWPLAVFFALLFFNTFLSTLKWHILLKADSLDVPLAGLFASYMIGTFFNLFMPSNIGGDAYRVYAVAKEAKFARSFSSVLADRISGFFALAAIGLAAAVLGRHEIGDRRVMLAPLLLLAALCAIITAAFSPALTKRLLRIARFDRLPKLYDFACRCMDAFSAYRKKGGTLAQVMAISFAFQLAVIVCIMLLAASLGIDIPAKLFFIFVPVISILEAIPVSIYGLGLRDFGYSLFFTQAGLPDPAAHALAISLLYVGATVVYSSLGGLFFLWRLYNIRLKKTALPRH